jgi:peptidoglycan/xylan/chitin deacetylase (PgdA/CDA1 family)
MSVQQLFVATYHYVRDLEHGRFPQIKGMPLADFRRQVKALPDLFEMATLESSLDFLAGIYTPKKNLCLLSFDDGLKEHHDDVMPELVEAGIQGIFFPITSCTNDQVVAPVHMNHFLMAELGVARYRTLFMEQLRALNLQEYAETAVNRDTARRTYPLDEIETAEFKYLFNFVLPAGQRDIIVKNLFVQWIGRESLFSSELYVNWSEIRAMQRVGMVIGGHSHAHRPLSKLDDGEVSSDLKRCWTLLTSNLRPQALWPFSYPYGKADSFNQTVVGVLRQLGFCCSLCTESGANLPGADVFAVRRLDCKKIIPAIPETKPAVGLGTIALSAGVV